MRKPSDRGMGHVQLGLAVGWVVLCVPAVLWWRESVTFVVFASVWANAAAHAAGWLAARPGEPTQTVTNDHEQREPVTKGEP